MSSTPNRSSAMRAFYRFEEAVREHEMRGGGYPELYEVKEDEYERARQAMIRTLEKLTCPSAK